MRPLTLIALLAGVWGARRLLAYADARRHQLEEREAMTTWEGEGGAVPVDINRTASQVTPPTDGPGEAGGRASLH